MSSISQSDPVNPAAFRKLMSLFATGVCVISFGRNEGDTTVPISAMTANSLVSVSLEPLLVSWSLHNSSSQFEEYTGATDFAISILADGQDAIARRYASRGDTGLDEADFLRTDRGMPVIKGALAFMECTRWATYPAGDHTLILGQVARMEAVSPESNPSALGFFGGRFCAIGE